MGCPVGPAVALNGPQSHAEPRNGPRCVLSGTGPRGTGHSGARLGGADGRESPTVSIYVWSYSCHVKTEPRIMPCADTVKTKGGSRGRSSQMP